MTRFIDCWISVARTLFGQALAGEPEFAESHLECAGAEGPVFGFAVILKGSVAGQFTVVLDPAILATPLVGDGMDQKSAWSELLREVAKAAAGEFLAKTGKECEVADLIEASAVPQPSRAFQLGSSKGAWRILVCDEIFDVVHESLPESRTDGATPAEPKDAAYPVAFSPGVELLLDVELEAALRFGCREMSLGEVLELGPGDVVELDRHVADPVDLIVGDKIVARGDIVLVNGNFGLRVTEVAAPRKKLESIRCLF